MVEFMIPKVMVIPEFIEEGEKVSLVMGNPTTGKMKEIVYIITKNCVNHSEAEFLEAVDKNMPILTVASSIISKTEKGVI